MLTGMSDSRMRKPDKNSMIARTVGTSAFATSMLGDRLDRA